MVTDLRLLAREKREVVTAALGSGLIRLHVDANAPGVRVPEKWNTSSALLLNVSYRYANVSVIIDEEKIAATLSFDGSSFRCIPALDFHLGLQPQRRDATLGAVDSRAGR